MLIYSWDSELQEYNADATTLLVKWYKYHLTLPLARLFRAENAHTELPPKPKGSSPLSSPLRNMIFLLTKRSEKAMIAAWSIFQGIKRGCGTVPDCFVDDAEESHHRKMT